MAFARPLSTSQRWLKKYVAKRFAEIGDFLAFGLFFVVCGRCFWLFLSMNLSMRKVLKLRRLTLLVVEWPCLRFCCA
jgi:hypothetical protein